VSCRPFWPIPIPGVASAKINRGTRFLALAVGRNLRLVRPFTDGMGPGAIWARWRVRGSPALANRGDRRTFHGSGPGRWSASFSLGPVPPSDPPKADGLEGPNRLWPPTGESKLAQTVELFPGPRRGGHGPPTTGEWGHEPSWGRRVRERTGPWSSFGPWSATSRLYPPCRRSFWETDGPPTNQPGTGDPSLVSRDWQTDKGPAGWAKTQPDAKTSLTNVLGGPRNKSDIPHGGRVPPPPRGQWTSLLLCNRRDLHKLRLEGRKPIKPDRDGTSEAPDLLLGGLAANGLVGRLALDGRARPREQCGTAPGLVSCKRKRPAVIDSVFRPRRALAGMPGGPIGPFYRCGSSRPGGKGRPLGSGCTGARWTNQPGREDRWGRKSFPG